MRLLNTLLFSAQSVALAATSDAQPLDHMFAADLVATIVGANAANKTFGAIDLDEDEITITGHGLLTGTKTTATTTTTLPAGLALATPYYVIAVDANTIKLAASQADALTGTAVDITDAGTGVHTLAITTALAGTVKLQKCNDPDSVPEADRVWFDIAAATAFSAAGNINWALVDIGYRLIRAVATVTSGTVTLNLRINAKGA